MESEEGRRLKKEGKKERDVGDTLRKCHVILHVCRLNGCQTEMVNQ